MSAVKALKLEELRLWQVTVISHRRNPISQFYQLELSSHHFGSATHLAIEQRALAQHLIYSSTKIQASRLAIASKQNRLI